MADTDVCSSDTFIVNFSQNRKAPSGHKNSTMEPAIKTRMLQGKSRSQVTEIIQNSHFDNRKSNAQHVYAPRDTGIVDQYVKFRLSSRNLGNKTKATFLCAEVYNRKSF